jgi:Tol biopolymer transport system component
MKPLRVVEFLLFPILAIILSACGRIDLQLPEIPFLQNQEPGSGLIAYVGGDRNIYTIDPDGERKQAVTDDAHPIPDDAGFARSYQYPTWSPDGRKLAFVGLDGVAGSDDLVTLYIASPDGNDRVEAYQSQEQYPFYLFWSPDSKRVTFLTTLPGQDLALKIVPAKGGETLTLETGAPFYWDWASDNRTILIHTGGSASSQPGARLALIDTEEEVQIPLDLRPTFFQAPAWSPLTDEFLLGVESESGGQSLLLTGRNGEGTRELARLSGPVFFGWSPDGKHLAYLVNDRVAPDGLSQTLTVLELKEPGAARKAKEELVLAFFWSPDSQRIAFFTPEVFTPTAVPGQPGQPDRVFLLRLHVFDVQSGESEEVALFRPTDDFTNILPYFDQYQHSATVWSPDGRDLVISAVDENGASGIYVVEVGENQEPRYLADGTVAFWSWR